MRFDFANESRLPGVVDPNSLPLEVVQQLCDIEEAYKKAMGDYQAVHGRLDGPGFQAYCREIGLAQQSDEMRDVHHLTKHGLIYRV